MASVVLGIVFHNYGRGFLHVEIASPRVPRETRNDKLYTISLQGAKFGTEYGKPISPRKILKRIIKLCTWAFGA